MNVLIYIAICDDEPIMLEKLFQNIQTFFQNQNSQFEIFTFTSGSELLNCKIKFNLIFLDIEMSGLSGMDVAKKLREMKSDCYLVFITVLSEYVFDSFEVAASDYLLKPVDFSRLHRTLDRIYNLLKQENNDNLIIFSKLNGCKSIPLKDIFYCETINHKMFIHTKDNIIEHYIKMEELEIKLNDSFFKCHRSYLVNLKYVYGFEKDFALLHNGIQIPVSRLRRQAFSQAILCYMKKGGAKI